MKPKPCPFCGSKIVIYTELSQSKKIINGYAVCEKCRMSFHRECLYKDCTKEQMIEWMLLLCNTRADDDIDAVLDEITRLNEREYDV